MGENHPTDLLIKGMGAGFTQWLSTIKLNSLKMWHEMQLMMEFSDWTVTISPCP